MATPTVKMQRIEGNIVELILSDPASKNALGYDLTAAFEKHVNALKNDPVTTSVIIRSESPDYFCSGGHLKERSKMTETEVDSFTSRMRQLIKNVELLPMPTIALLSGSVIGGGLELALAADLRILSKATNLSLPQCRLGIVPGLGGMGRLTKLIGIGRAKEMVFTCEKIDPAAALSIGLANGLEDNYAKAHERCIKIAKGISKGSLVALKEAKRVFLEMESTPKIEEIEVQAYRNTIKNKEREAALKKFTSGSKSKK